MSKNILFILLLAFIGLSLNAQTVNGTILNKSSGEPIPFANVIWLKAALGTVADFDGKFAIKKYLGDTLSISTTGFKTLKLATNQLPINGVFYLQEESTVLADVKIKVKRRNRRKRKGDPAYLLHQKIASNRGANDIKELPYYSCAIYNKVEVDLNNVDSNTKNLLLFRPISFVFDNPDTVSQKKPFAPVFFSEAYSKYYYDKPNKEKEVIHASNNAGIKVSSLAQFTGNVYTDFNIYNNYIRIFQKSFVSPLSKASWLTYKYYLTDSVIKNDTTFYTLKFLPRREQDLAFEGYLITNNKSYGLNEIEFRIPQKTNINYVEEFVIKQKYIQVDSISVLAHENILIDVNPLKKTYGFYIQKNTSWFDYDFESKPEANFFTAASKTEVKDSAYAYGAELLDSLRPTPLKLSEKATYVKVDSAMNTRYLKTIQNLSQMAYTGYYPFKYWEYGPYYTTYSYNSLEGERLRVGFLTTQGLMKKTRFGGHLAYGLGDEQFKYRGKITKYYGFKKWRYFEFEHLNDFKILSASDNAFQEDNILASLTRRVDPKYTHTIRSRFTWSHEWQKGINNAITLNSERLIPIGSLTYTTPKDESVDELNIHSVKIGGRFALHEKFIQYGFRRLSLLTTKPRINYAYTHGFKVENTGFEFQKVEIDIADRYYFGYLGFLDLKLFGSKTWGQLPYPLLLNHQGNDSYYFDNEAFNLMNPFEFVSDQQVSVIGKYNFNGLVFNRLPVIKKMHLRSFLFARGVYGSLNDKHEKLIVLPDGLTALDEPYLETGFGIENIFKIIRLDFIWRLTNVSSSDLQQFGVTFDIVPNF